MTPQEVQREVHRRISIIEDEYSQGQHVPPEVQSYYRLCELIALRSVSEYLRRYPGLPIDIESADSAKRDFGWGAISSFEKESAEFLNSEIERRERNERPIELHAVDRNVFAHG